MKEQTRGRVLSPQQVRKTAKAGGGERGLGPGTEGGGESQKKQIWGWQFRPVSSDTSQERPGVRAQSP